MSKTYACRSGLVMPNSKRKCTGCKDYFPREGFIKINGGYFHNFDCAISTAKSRAYDKKTKEIKQRYSEKGPGLEVAMGECAKKLGEAFNFYVRERDWDLNCISCYKPIRKVGRNYHAGHFLPYGSKYKYSPIRWDERNVNGQCCKCNSYQMGRQAEYEAGLIERYGQQHVDDVKELKRQVDSGQVKPYTKEEMMDRTKYYNKLARALKKERI